MIRIVSINKSHGHHADPHHAISSLDWVNVETGDRGRSTRLEVYEWIKNQNGKAYVTDKWGNKAFVGTRENMYGTKYLQTYSDRVWTDNLLALPETVLK